MCLETWHWETKRRGMHGKCEGCSVLICFMVHTPPNPISDSSHFLFFIFYFFIFISPQNSLLLQFPLASWIPIPSHFFFHLCSQFIYIILYTLHSIITLPSFNNHLTTPLSNPNPNWVEFIFDPTNLKIKL